MTKKTVLPIIVCLAFGMVAAGCSSNITGTSQPDNTAGGGTTTKDVEFTYWYPWGGDSEKWDKWRIDEFEKNNPGYKVNSVYVPTDSGVSNGKLVASISGGNPPDVVTGNDKAYFLASQGALTPLDDYLKESGFKEDELLGSFYDLMKYKGKTYFFPVDSNVNLLYYNAQMFRDAGLDPDNPPRTIEELDAAAEALTKVENNKIDRLGFIPWLDAGDNAYLWGWIFGANFYDVDSSKVLINDSRLAASYKWQNEYAKKYNPEKIKSFTSGFGGAFSADHPFFTGKVAMTVNGNWFANALKLYAPDIDYRVASIPFPEGGREKASILETNVFMIPKGAKKPDEAIKFILYGSQPEINADNINIWRSISVYKKPSEAIKWDELNDAVYKVVREVAASPNSGHPVLSSVSNEMSTVLKLIRDSVIYNDKDPGPQLEKEQARLQGVVDKADK